MQEELKWYTNEERAIIEAAGGCPKPEPRPKKEPKPLKRTELKKKPYKLNRGGPIKKQTAKQAEKLANYEAGKREKYSQQESCKGCKRADVNISCAHIVPRSHSFALVDYPMNHVPMCMNRCHDLLERGHMWELSNGLELMNLLWDGLGGAGRQRFWKVYYQWPQNQDLWKHSPFFNPEIHE